MKFNKISISVAACVLLVAITVVFIILPAGYVVPVLMYHNIDTNTSSSLSVAPQSFERQMKFLKESGYNVISFEALIRLIKGKKPFKAKTIVITFDDGYENNYTYAYPMLKKYNLPATIFVIVADVGKSGYLNWDEIREMSLHDITIGSHTLTHPYLTSLDEASLDKELTLSKKILEEKLNKEVNLMSYPLGGFNRGVIEAVKKAGYIGACATNPGKKYPNNDIYAIKRIRISRTSDSLLVFWIETSGFYTWIKERRDKD
ncbi:MAG: polysaccharide deacetylase family protein [Candidatus Omnitrophota bacterium]